MSFHRAIIAALAALFVAGTASVALADCGGCGWAAPPIAYQPVPLYTSGGCGGCGGSFAVTYAPAAAYAPPAFAPAPAPIAPAPIAVDHWDTGGCGWGGCRGIGCGCGRCGCGGSALYAPAPIYVVNQGPEYTGPGVMIPYGTYSPEAGLAAPYDYPYISRPGYRHGYGGYAHRYFRGAGPRYAYGERGYVHPHPYGPTAYGHRYPYPRRPVGVRGW